MLTRLPHRRQTAFTLVELAIVLVILGLLVGGIMVGQTLVRTAELQNISTMTDKVTTACHAFRDKYFALPGDMANATQFWGTNTASACTITPVAGDRVAKTATCDGNGDRMVGATVGTYTELFRSWQHLTNAGMIEGSFTGVSGSAGSDDADPGTNVPPIRIAGAGMQLRPTTGACWWSDMNNKHGLQMGSDTSDNPYGAILTPAELLSLDIKRDDGQPGYGSVRGPIGTDCAIQPSCTTSNVQVSAQYNTSAKDNQCAFYSVMDF
jgi:prepilin-type N-terminal cleavage/methylation domain-containing protein